MIVGRDLHWGATRSDKGEAVKMRSYWNRLVCQAVLGAMMLLVSAANLVSISYDADDQDEVPPVTVELKFVVHSLRSASDLRPRAVDFLAVFSTVEHKTYGLAETAYTRAQLEKGSPQLLVPLLC